MEDKPPHSEVYHLSVSVTKIDHSVATPRNPHHHDVPQPHLVKDTVIDRKATVVAKEEYEAMVGPVPDDCEHNGSDVSW